MKVRSLFLTIKLMFKNNKNLKIEDLMFKNSAKIEFMKYQDSIADSAKIYNELLTKIYHQFRD